MIVIEMNLKDKNGTELSLGDTVQLFNWGASDGESLGTATIMFDMSEGCLITDPTIIEDSYDLVTKALPRCLKI